RLLSLIAECPYSTLIACSIIVLPRFFLAAATSDIYTLSLHDALPIFSATDIAQRLHKAIEQAVVPLGGVTLRFTVSIGQVSLKGDGDLLGLLRRAEFALLEARRARRNRICIG